MDRAPSSGQRCMNIRVVLNIENLIRCLVLAIVNFWRHVLLGGGNNDLQLDIMQIVA